jgi:hypothetical protein
MIEVSPEKQRKKPSIHPQGERLPLLWEILESAKYTPPCVKQRKGRT